MKFDAPEGVSHLIKKREREREREIDSLHSIMYLQGTNALGC